MEETVMISLVGEQPIPNLLAVLYAKPHHAVFVHTDRTEPVSKRLCKVLKVLNGRRELCSRLKVNDPYNMATITQELQKAINNHGWSADKDKLVFNVTGGTKPMAFAAYRLAEQLKCPFLYLQSEGPNTIAYHYVFGEDSVAQLDKKIDS